MEQLQTQALQLAIQLIGYGFTIVGILVAAYKTKLIDLANAKAKTINDERTQKLADSGLERIDNLISKELVNIETTMKPAIIQAISDGTMTQEDLNHLSIIAKDNVLAQIGTDTLDAVNGTIGDINKYIASTIEDTLSKLKDDPNSIVQHTVLPEVITPAVDNAELQKKNNELTQQVADLQTKLQQINNTLNPVQG